MKRFLHYFIFLIPLFSAIACGAKKDSAEGILSHPEMVNALLDIYVAEQKVNALHLPVDSATLVFKKLSVKVLESKNTPDSVLKKSYDYYLEHPTELEEIYTALVDSLNLREQRSISKPAGI